ncbi:hypothetical protein NDR87_31870 [Nocardia sp. CDC159]|uniref:Uncharacterized protein n=1 Tax=Nocardia pulmonis TaxID=2951408 RepID=A0A9X2J0Q8_9NOCA|nr:MULTISPECIES: hypothetical protein [Nocardia]MCM6778089.1 hypothetical protein [Nocardia pulmonis]MCM6790978.1 hypothetical protein [Nocardia sp. CDC159]
MTLRISAWLITSDVTPEFAQYLPTATGGYWSLSWLPEVALTRDQAISGMVLDETLSDPRLVHNRVAYELSAFRAAELGISLEQALIRLFGRILDHDAESACETESSRGDGPGRPLIAVGRV